MPTTTLVTALTAINQSANDDATKLSNFNAEFIKPWAKKKSILMTAMEGYSYGSEPGQIKRLSDNNFIIPLYDYGVGVYDFAPKQAKEAKEISIIEAKKAIEDYFTNKK